MFLRAFFLFVTIEVVLSSSESADEVVGTCGTRGEIKNLILDILCKEPRDARKFLVDKLWKCKNGALDKAMLTRELLQMAAQDADRPATCKNVAEVGRGLPSAVGGGPVGMSGGGSGGGAMDPDDVPCTRESIDRIFMQILCREPSQKEAFGRMWQCKNNKLGDRKLANMLTHFVVTGREKRESNCGPLPNSARMAGPPSESHPVPSGGGVPIVRPVTVQRPAAAAQETPLSPDECPGVVSEAFTRVLCRDPNTAEKTAAIWRCRKHSESRDRVFASLGFLSRKFSVVSECAGGGYGE
jgi:hypothetical protein